MIRWFQNLWWERYFRKRRAEFTREMAGLANEAALTMTASDVNMIIANRRDPMKAMG